MFFFNFFLSEMIESEITSIARKMKKIELMSKKMKEMLHNYRSNRSRILDGKNSTCLRCAYVFWFFRFYHERYQIKYSSSWLVLSLVHYVRQSDPRRKGKNYVEFGFPYLFRHSKTSSLNDNDLCKDWKTTFRKGILFYNVPLSCLFWTSICMNTSFLAIWILLSFFEY